LEGVVVFGAVEPGSEVSAGAVLSEPSGTMPGLSPELAVGSAYAVKEANRTPSSAHASATTRMDDLLEDFIFTNYNP
jgi:hypothetical protein